MKNNIITKREFFENSSFHQIGKGNKRILYLFYELKKGFGYKYLIKGLNITKMELFDLSYNNLINKLPLEMINKYNINNVQIRTANSDEERFKLKIINKI